MGTIIKSPYFEAAYRICVVAILALIAFQQIVERRSIEAISVSYEPPDVQRVEVINREPLAVDANISVETKTVGGYRYQEPIPVQIKTGSFP
jgi:hypothetical protein